MTTKKKQTQLVRKAIRMAAPSLIKAAQEEAVLAEQLVKINRNHK
jgi:hypothetical protein